MGQRGGVVRSSDHPAQLAKFADGMQQGYDLLPLIRALKGGNLGTNCCLRRCRHHGTCFYEAAQAGADILLGASVFHFLGIIKIPELKQYLRSRGVNVRHGQQE